MFSLLGSHRRRKHRWRWIPVSGVEVETAHRTAFVGQALEERRLLALAGELELQTVATGLASPVSATHADDGSGRLFFAEQGGLIKIVQNGAVRSTPFLDLSDRIVAGGERGLLGLAFHPDFATPGVEGNGKFYVYYSALALAGGNHDSVVAEYRVSASDMHRADAGSERILLRFSQPFSNHNGGDLKFGPDDGWLYISTGDGGSGGDPQNNAQNLGNLLGKILRIDVNGTNGPGDQYGIPPSNPFVGQAGARPEIYAYGFRNPFRMSFDDGPNGSASDDRLFVGDVGQGSWEEVDSVFAGGNYGWRFREGAHCFNPAEECPTEGLIDPIAEYPNPDKGRAVIGGFVYRGQEFPDLRGQYVFGDLSGRMFLLEDRGEGRFDLSEPMVRGGNPIGSNILGFGEDEAGEIYVLTPNALRRIAVRESPAPWRNPDLAADIDGNGLVELFDLLTLVRFLRDNGTVELAAPDDTFAPPPYYDPTGDGLAAVVDLLAVVRVLREQQTGLLGEPESDDGFTDELAMLSMFNTVP